MKVAEAIDRLEYVHEMTDRLREVLASIETEDGETEHEYTLREVIEEYERESVDLQTKLDETEV